MNKDKFLNKRIITLRFLSKKHHPEIPRMSLGNPYSLFPDHSTMIVKVASGAAFSFFEKKCFQFIHPLFKLGRIYFF